MLPDFIAEVNDLHVFSDAERYKNKPSLNNFLIDDDHIRFASFLSLLYSLFIFNLMFFLWMTFSNDKSQKVVKAMGKTWHEDHFVCSGPCKKPMAAVPFFEKDGKPYWWVSFWDNCSCSVIISNIQFISRWTIKICLFFPLTANLISRNCLPPNVRIVNSQ